jgi:ABC transporter substrate binding protein
VALDFFTVPTATFRVLFVLVVLSHGRRRLVHFNVTEHPTAEWTGGEVSRRSDRSLRRLETWTARRSLSSRATRWGELIALTVSVAELLSTGAAILVTGGPYGSLAAKRATTTAPIVFVAANSPVEVGLVANLARPGGNLTGWRGTPGRRRS